MLILFIVSANIENCFCYIERDLTDCICGDINEALVCDEVFLSEKFMESNCSDTLLSHGVVPLRDGENFILKSLNHLWEEIFIYHIKIHVYMGGGSDNGNQEWGWG